ncbi:MAG TPA: type IV toxin-antitoxin system AbiEi family antitoxin domain-containing protein [Solirubrobacterales bacterium]|nr:type IV toxin-antitoxin system AbiEi family antitoxin domain-containing protein [Solirubrobacterales bacterium]
MRTASALATLAEDQWGLLTRRQAEAAGISTATLQRLSAPGGVLERMAHGVYHLAGAPLSDHADLRAAWLALDPDTVAWERDPEQGVVSHRSAAALYGIGHLPADHHDFTLPARRQTRRKDVRLHRRPLADREWITLRGLPVTRPSRIAADLLREREDPGGVAQIVVDALREAYDSPATFAEALSPVAARLGFRSSDGLAVLRWMIELAGAEEEGRRWLEDANKSVKRDGH